MENKKISVIVSVYNEQEVLQHFHEEITGVISGMGISYEIVYINDGSVDLSQEILASAAAEDPSVKVINFSRNFGHEAAMIAGIDHSCGEFLVCIDADLEKPPAELPRMYQAFLEGNDIVNMVYRDDQNRNKARKIMTKLYYKFLNSIARIRFTENSSDFFGISRTVADILKVDYRERKRYIRGFIQSMGYRSTSLEYIPGKRYAGSSKYNFRALMNLAEVAIINFSGKPLRLGFYLSALCLLMTLGDTVLLAKDIIMRTGGMHFDLLTLIALLLFTLTFFLMGVIGIYLEDIQQECRKDPIYHIKDGLNLDSEAKMPLHK